MKCVILILLMLIIRISVFCQNYILIDKRLEESKDTAYVDTVKMPVYLIGTTPLGYMNQVGLTVPKYIIPLSHLNKKFTIGDYLTKYHHNNCKEDSVLFFINFSDYIVKNRSYFSSATDIPVLEELNNFMNDTALFSLLPQTLHTYEIEGVNTLFSIYIVDAVWIRVRIKSAYRDYYTLNHIRSDRSLNWVSLYFLQDITSIAPVIDLRNQGMVEIR